MVKKVLMAALALLLAGSAAAQRVQFGVRAGVFSQDMELRLSDLGSSDIMTDAKLGFHVAAVARVRITAIGRGALGMGIYLQPEVIYTQNTYRMQQSGSNPTTKIRMQSIDIPVLLSFKLSIVRLQAGPVFNAMYRTPIIKGDMGFMSIKPTVGYGLGLSVDIFGGLVLDGRYNGQFKKLKNNLKESGEDAYTSVKGSLSSWAVGLSWLF